MSLLDFALVLFGLPAVCGGVWLAVRLRARRRRGAEQREQGAKTKSTDGGGGPIEP